MRLPMITRPEELISLVEDIGFLPFFENGVEGFSLKDCTPAEFWFVEGVDGPWEWKGQVLPRLCYGKLYNKKAGFISREWLPHLCNYRRDGYDFEGFYEDGLASYKSKGIVETLCEQGPLLSRALKAGREKGFDSAITALQMQTFVTAKAFEYSVDKHGVPYGWGVARYALMEQVFGVALVNSANCTPEESLKKMLDRLKSLWPGAQEKELMRLLKR